jgi:hypothetical protein
VIGPVPETEREFAVAPAPWVGVEMVSRGPVSLRLSSWSYESVLVSLGWEHLDQPLMPARGGHAVSEFRRL